MEKARSCTMTRDKMFKWFTAKGATVNSYETTTSSAPNLSWKDKTPDHPIFEAVERNDQAVEKMIKSGVNVNLFSEKGSSLLQEAVRFGNMSAVNILLEYKADVNAMNVAGKTALFMAAETNNVDIIRRLAVAGGNPNILCNKSTPLHVAASASHADAVIALLDVGANPRIKNSRGYSPLHVASGRSVIEVLVSKSPNMLDMLSSKKLDGNAPLHCAARRGNREDVHALIDLGADINICNGEGHTPLACAAWTRSINCARLLIDEGAKVNLRDHIAYTPLHVAALMGHLDMVMLLLSAKADPTLKAKHLKYCRWIQCTPSVVATYKGHIQIFKVLKKLELLPKKRKISMFEE